MGTTGKIGKRLVDATAADPGGRRYVWDAEIKGFGLVVLPSGVKSYFFNYRAGDGRERRITIGKHGAWTPEAARTKAKALRNTVRDGGDPLAEKRERRQAPTVAELLHLYLASERFQSKAATTRAIDKGRIERHLKPQFGARPVIGLTPGDVERAFAAIRDGKTKADVKTGKRGRARVRGGEGTARAAIKLLRSAFNWAVGEKLAAANPCQGIKVGVDGTRDTILEDAAAYGRLFRTLDAMERENRIRGPVADAIRLIALTGARRGEIAGLQWGQVDLKRCLIILPPTRHKAGRRTGKPRVIVLPAAAQALITRQPPGPPDAFVFAPAKGAGPLELSKAWRRKVHTRKSVKVYGVAVEAELPEGIGLHGLRHSLGSHLAMGGAQAAEIMTALGHTQLSTSQRYIHWAESAHKAVAERAAAVALAGMAAAAGEEKAPVVPIAAGESKGRRQGEGDERATSDSDRATAGPSPLARGHRPGKG